MFKAARLNLEIPSKLWVGWQWGWRASRIGKSVYILWAKRALS